MAAWLAHTVGNATAAHLLLDAHRLVLGGYFSAERGNLRRYPLSLYRSLAVQQTHANAEADHFIERTWGLLLTAARPLPCDAVVPSPRDAPPFRSPQAVHTYLAQRIFAGHSVAEIGTRRGDGMVCFALAARRAVAIEIDEQYCRALRARSAQLARAYPGRFGAPPDAASAFTVSCTDFFKAGEFLDADYITWWEQAPLLNTEALSFLHSQQRARRIRPTAVAVLLFDKGFRADRVGLDRLLPLAAWSQEVWFDEHARCARMQQAGNRSRDGSGTPGSCDRARGTFVVLGIPVNDSRLATIARANTSQPADASQGRTAEPAAHEVRTTSFEK
jgi:hypothetical protein